METKPETLKTQPNVEVVRTFTPIAIKSLEVGNMIA